MSKYMLSLTALAFLAAGAWSQDENSAEESDLPSDISTTVEPIEDTNEPDDADSDEAVDDADLDIQTYEEDEDDFVPSEEIPADEPIPFPSNI